jgi:hypothetical protein
MTDDRTSTSSAEIVDFAAFRARRLAEQATLFDPSAAPSEAWLAPARLLIGPGSGERLMTRRAVEHRERMLRHLQGLHLGGVKA